MKKKLSAALAIGVACALYGYAMYNTAWLSDDAYISYRSVDNLVHGYGLTWNTDERVQAFTNPLWVLINVPAYLAAKVSWQIYFSGLFTSVVVSFMAIGVIAFGVAETPALAVFGVLALTFCRAYMDYSTSGLENPMTHLLLALLVVYMARIRWTMGTLFAMALCAGLSLVNRMDTALIFAPVLAYAWLAERNLKATLSMAAGLLPFIAWEIFSVVYYGFPFPNTAYAKLGNGIDGNEVLFQGLWYLWNAWNTDPLTVVLIVLGLGGAPFLLRDGRYTALALGGALYVLYLVKVGGDFMQGRLLTPVLMVAVLLLLRLRLRSGVAAGTAVLLALCISLTAPDLSLLTKSAGNKKFDAHRVADERQFWMAGSGFKNWHNGLVFPIHQYVDKGRSLAAMNRYQAQTFMSVGFRGYFAGPKVHIVDAYALADPLLARMPAIYVPNWRIGHFTRHVPKWYSARKSAMTVELQKKVGDGPALSVDEVNAVVPVKEDASVIAPTLQAGAQHPSPEVDADLEAFYDRLELIVRGPLWSPERWKAIVNMNLGRYNALIHGDTYRYPGLATHTLAEVSDVKAAGTAWNAPGTLPLPKSGMEIRLDGVKHNALVEMSADHNDDYRVLFFNGDQPVGQVDLPPSTEGKGLQIFTITTPNSAIRAGYDAVRIVAYGGDNKSSLGHLRLP